MRFLCRLGFHKYELKMQLGVYDYHECICCEARTYVKRLGYTGYSAIDWKWLKSCKNPQFGNSMGPR